MQTAIHTATPSYKPFFSYGFLNKPKRLLTEFYNQKLQQFVDNNKVQYDKVVMEKHINPTKSFQPTFLLIKNSNYFDLSAGRMIFGKLISHGTQINVIKSWINSPLKEYSLLWVCPPDKQIIQNFLRSELKKYETSDINKTEKIWNDYLDRMYVYPAPKNPETFWKEVTYGF